MPLPEVKLKALLTLLAATSLVSPCNAFFRNLMISDTAMARVDPIVNRGEPAMHVHHLTGGGNLNFESTGETLSTSNCTNSILTQDKSAYWAPWMYFEHENGTVQDVKLALGLTAYYKFETRGNTGGDVEYSVFPKGLKMLSGDSSKRNWTSPWPVPAQSLWGPEDTTQEALQEKAMGFNCMNYESGKNEPSFAYPWLRNKDYLDAHCTEGVRAEIIFPSCWDGKNLDSDDHKSHTAFPTLIQDGVCPETHPIYLPILFYETIWQTNAFKDLPGRFVLANGDPTGYGYHADFIAAWDDGVQEQVRDNPQCTGLTTDGVVENCPVFQGRIQSQQEAASCKLTLPSSIAGEQTDGIMEGLPGDVKISGVQHDPGSPGGSSETYAPSSSVPASRSSAEATATDTSDYYHSAATTASPTTFATSPPPAQSQYPSTTTTTYTSGKYVVEMVLVDMVQTVTATTAPTMTHTVVVDGTGESARAKSRIRARKHVRNHGHY
ncbi:hypothetical protein LTR70_009375 [Exophiala xenobiotica]|uniref:DUF1996 domain-containing protein n=1 Tax=Lithohypha guttulata TaxID=1690604 RepID=A0ABR0JXJ5_9EURO|nr:hypothetical protein LTR24_009234 [Lithohypha guttulata]KAK5310558.1 hypothetical protein LTR70_009375 [Exophiala xenobiotica]